MGRAPSTGTLWRGACSTAGEPGDGNAGGIDAHMAGDAARKVDVFNARAEEFGPGHPQPALHALQ